MRLPPSARIVLNNLPGTVLDVALRARVHEGTVRARMAELQRAGLVKATSRRKPHPRAWFEYEAV